MSLTPEEEFRCFAVGYWNETRSGHAARAALNTEAVEQLVALWQAEGMAGPRLHTLLEDPSAEVRYFAAALLGSGDQDARSALDGLARDRGAGLPAGAAQALLRQWRRKLITVTPVEPG